MSFVPLIPQQFPCNCHFFLLTKQLALGEFWPSAKLSCENFRGISVCIWADLIPSKSLPLSVLYCCILGICSRTPAREQMAPGSISILSQSALSLSQLQHLSTCREQKAKAGVSADCPRGSIMEAPDLLKYSQRQSFSISLPFLQLLSSIPIARLVHHAHFNASSFL